MRKAIIAAIIIAIIAAAIIAFLVWYFFFRDKGEPMLLLAVNDCDSTDLDLVADGSGNYYAAYDCPRENRVEIIKIVNDAAGYDDPRPIFEGVEESHVSISVTADGTVYAFAVVGNDLRSITCENGSIQDCANPMNVSGSFDDVNGRLSQTFFVAPNSDLFRNAIYNTGSASIVPVHETDSCIGHHDSAVGSTDAVYEVWENDCTQEIMFSASYDKGATWTQTVNLSNSPRDSQEPRVAASGDTVHVTWVDNSTGANEIFYSESTDAGSTFNGGTGNNAGNPLNLSNTPGSSTDHEICVSGNDFYAVWRDLDTGNGDIYFAKNNGQAQNLDPDPKAAYEPDIACKDGTVIIGFTRERGSASGQGDAFFIKSTDGGATFSDPKNISNNENGDSKTALVSISRDNEIYGAWLDTDGDRQYIDQGTYAVFASKSRDGGETFSEPKNYSDDPANLKKDDDVESEVFELEDKVCVWDTHCIRCQSATGNY